MSAAADYLMQENSKIDSQSEPTPKAYSALTSASTTKLADGHHCQNPLSGIQKHMIEYYQVGDVQKCMTQMDSLLTEKDNEIVSQREQIGQTKTDNSTLKEELHKLLNKQDADSSTPKFANQFHTDVLRMVQTHMQQHWKNYLELKEQLRFNKQLSEQINEKNQFIDSMTKLKKYSDDQVKKLQEESQKKVYQNSQLTANLAAKGQEIEDLNKRMRELKEQHSKREKELKTEVETKIYSLMKSQEEIQRQNDEFLKLKTTNELTNSQLSDNIIKMDQLNSELKTTQESKREKENENKELNTMLELTKSQLKDSKQMQEKEVDQHAQTQKQLGNRNQRLENIQNTIKSWTDKLSALKIKTLKNVQGQKQTDEIDQINLIGQELLQLMTSYNELKTSSDNLQIRFENKDSLLTKSQIDNRGLQQKLDEQRTLQLQLCKDKDVLNQLNHDLQKEQNKTQLELQDTLSKLSDSQNIVTNLKSQVEVMTKQLKDEKNSYRQLIERSQTEAKEWEEIERKISSEKEQLSKDLLISQGETQVEKLNLENETQQHTQTKQTLEKLTNEKIKLDKDLLRSREYAAKLAKDLQSETHKVLDKNRLYQQLQENHQGTLIELKEIQDSLEAKKNEFDQLSTDYVKAQVKLQNAKDTIEKCEDNLKAEQEKHKLSQQNLEQKLQNLNKDLQNQIKESSIQLTNTDGLLTNSQKEVKRLNNQIEDMKKANQNQIKTQEQKMQDLTNQLNVKTTESQNLLINLTKKVEDHKHTMKELESTKDNCEQLQKDLKKSANKLETQIKDFNDKNIELEITKAQLKCSKEETSNINSLFKKEQNNHEQTRQLLTVTSTTLTRVQSQYSQEQKEHESTKQDLEQTIQNLKDKSDDLSKEQMDHMNTNDSLEQLKVAKSKVETQFQFETLTHKKTKETLSTTKENLKNTAANLEDERQRHVKTKNDLDLKIKNVIIKILDKQKLNKKNNQLSIQLKDSQTNFKNLQVTYNAILKQFEEMKPMNMTTVEITKLECNFTKDDILVAKKETLYFLIQTINEAVQGLHMIKGKDIVVTLGNTGAGKSTLLNSIVFGAGQLEWVKDNKTKKFVIDQNESCKMVNQLKIGHNTAVSQTFRPEIIYCEEFECFFIDIAGFKDSQGEYFDLMNCFVIKYLFQNAKSVKFICPFTHNELSNARGLVINQLVDQLQLMCKGHLVNIVQSVIPVITKCNPNNKVENIDIDQIRDDIYTQLLESFNIPEEQDSLKQGEKEQEMSDDLKFIDSFSFNHVIVDALDRSIENLDGKVQSTPLSDFKQIIKECVASDPINLNTPFTQKCYFQLCKLIDKSFSQLEKTAIKYINDAKEQGEKFKLQIEEHQHYTELKKCLQFLDDLELLTDSKDQLIKLNSSTKAWQELIDLAKLFKNMSELEKKALIIRHELCLHHNNKDAKKFVLTLNNIAILVKELKTAMSGKSVGVDQAAKMSNVKTKLNTEIENYITEYCNKDKKMFYQVCYELLVLESDKQKKISVEDILRGQVKPDILRQIICSNKYDPNKKAIVPRSSKYFSISVGAEFSFLQYNPKDSNSKDSLILSKELVKGYDNKFQFQLTKDNGFLLIAGKNIVCPQKSVTQMLDQRLAIVNNNAQIDEKNLWHFIPPSKDSAKQDFPYLFIQQKHEGLHAPRLINMKKSLASKDEPWVSAKAGQHYDDDEFSVWKIFKAD